ncbi:beta-1,6-N-acetylglucosaminyltransferase [Hymenobacter volaticus]|uniref:Peptide O-xylosyltransferase n=1 Tax=Hymenobacter volaticus TaxID=2932254 RepID=A0ABY4GA17_9BACT|nr:beta-1,6-N-acetylglucosaminyltransferase [Hymenobacter volaticus]UOQ67739.1 beta-1,6-N-acetylglucosaminyltransferase [Hymenobacter volaticus]
MDINYIILAHKNPEQVGRLISRLSTSNTRFYIHVDSNSAIEPFKQQLATTKHCFLLENREKGTWGDLGIVKATIHALRKIIRDHRRGYCVLLSGQDYPIKPNKKIESFLTIHQGTSFVSAFALPKSSWDYGGMNRIEYYKFNLSDNRGDYLMLPYVLSKEFLRKWVHYVHTVRKLVRLKRYPWEILKKRRFPRYMQPFGGSQWWAIPVEVAEKLLFFFDHNPKFLSYHQYTLLPDEIVFQSLVKHLHITPIKPSITYVNWERPNVVLPVTFNENDFQELLSQPEEMLFARKFDAENEPKILDLIDQFLLTG